MPLSLWFFTKCTNIHRSPSTVSTPYNLKPVKSKSHSTCSLGGDLQYCTLNTPHPISRYFFINLRSKFKCLEKVENMTVDHCNDNWHTQKKTFGLTWQSFYEPHGGAQEETTHFGQCKKTNKTQNCVRNVQALVFLETLVAIKLINK